ncbi:Ras-related protein Rab-3 [Entamoeba marina]
MISIYIGGDYNVGKTTFSGREILNSANSPYPWLDFRLKEILIDRTKIQLILWDTHDYYRGNWQRIVLRNKYFIFLYDVSYKNSFNSTIDMIQQLKTISPEVVVTLVGNKIDIDNREVSTIDGFNASKELGCFGFYEMSLKEEIYSSIVDDLIYDAYEKQIWFESSAQIKKEEKPSSWKCLLQ